MPKRTDISKILVLVCCLLAPSLQAQEKKVVEVDRLCGRLEHVERTPDREYPSISSEKRSGLRGVDLALYDRRDNESCCIGSAIETARTRRGGRFNFETKRPGTFWIASNWNGRDYRLPVIYKPEKTSEINCSNQGIEINDKGTSIWWATVTVTLD
jgi:hypothetical protein